MQIISIENKKDFEKALKDFYLYKEQDIIFNLLLFKDFNSEYFNALTKLSQEKNKENCSFVIVQTKFTYEQIPSQIEYCPSVQEAQDIIDMNLLARELNIEN